MNLDEMLSGMLAEVKALPKKKRKRTNGKGTISPTTPQYALPAMLANPFQDKNLVLLMLVHDCKCGTVHASPNTHLMVESTRVRAGKFERVLQRVPPDTNLSIFAHLPRVQQEYHIAIPHCPSCFYGTAVQDEVQVELEFCETSTGELKEILGIMLDYPVPKAIHPSPRPPHVEDAR